VGTGPLINEIIETKPCKLRWLRFPATMRPRDFQRDGEVLLIAGIGE